MRKRQSPGMKALPAEIARWRTTIDIIPHQRMPDRGHVNPDLMGSAGVKFALHEAKTLDRIEQGNDSLRGLASGFLQIDHGMRRRLRGSRPTGWSTCRVFAPVHAT